MKPVFAVLFVLAAISTSNAVAENAAVKATGFVAVPDEGESANVPATSSGVNRYLFALPKFKDNGANGHVYPDDLLPPEDATLTLSGISKPVSVKLLGDHGPLDFSYTNQTLTIQLPAAKRTQLVDVARIELMQQTPHN